MSDNVIVLAGSKWQIPLIKRLKEKGFRVINYNLYSDSPAFQYADEVCILDILDNEKCLLEAKKVNPKAVMSEECDIAVVPVAWLSEKLNLKSIGLSSAKLYTNKYLMRQFGKENGFPTPIYYKCDSKEQAMEYYEKFGKKMILKPIDSNSSRGVFTVNDKSDIEKFWDSTIAFSKAEKSVLLEEYIEGVEFTIDGIKTENGHMSLAISEKKHYKYNENIASSLFFSHSNPKFDYDKLRRINDQYVNLSGLSYGLTHAEYKFYNGQFYLIEIGARGGGNMISALIVPFISGVDNYGYLIDKTLGIKCSESIRISRTVKERCAILQFFDTNKPIGRVKEIKGKDYLEKCKNIIDFGLYFDVGDIITNAEDDSKRIGYYIACGENETELQTIIKQVNDNFMIIMEGDVNEGKNS